MARRWAHPICHRLCLVLIALLGGFGLGLLALGYTPVLAGFCPGCFGFHKIGPNVYSERIGPETAGEMLRRLERAEARVAAVFGPQERPQILICYTDTCHRVMGAGDVRAMTYGLHLFYLTPDGHDVEIIAHELAHVALHRQIGLKGLRYFPAWLDEGVATYVSRDPRFDLDPATCDPGGGELPLAAADWRHSDGARDASYYAAAGCRVARWVKAHPISGFEDMLLEYTSR